MIELKMRLLVIICSILTGARFFVVVDGYELHDIGITGGKLEVVGYNNCAINVNGLTLNYIGPHRTTFPGLYFGLINYHCDNVEGFLISNIECFECGVYCQQNEYIKGCEQHHFKTIIIVVSSITLSAIFTFILTYICFNYGHHLTDWVLYCYYRYHDKVESGRINELSQRVNVEVKPIFKPIQKVRGKKVIRLIEKKRRLSNNEPSNISKAGSLMALSVLGSCIDISSACDMTLYIKGTDQICDTNGCKQINMFSFPLLTGSTVCFKDHNNDIIEFSIFELEYNVRYNKQYYTSNYSIETQSYWKCQGSGDCWGYDSCNPSTRGKFIKSDIEGYGCDNVVATCDTYCWQAGACTFWKWSLSRKGLLVPVYKRVGRIWGAVLLVQHKGNTFKVPFNSNNPTHDILGSILTNFKKFPMIVTNFMTEDKTDNINVIRIDDKVYGVKASDVNFPQHELIGDFQIGLDEKTQTFSSTGVICKTNHCRAECLYKEPTLSRVLRNLKNLDRIDNWVTSVDQSILDTKIQVPGSISIMIGNVDVESLQVLPSKCDIKLVTVYGCTGCDTKPYAVFKSYNIQQTGLITFESNCTFNVNYLSCNQDLYTLYLQDSSRLCTIVVPSLNSTFHIDIKYIYKGELDPTLILHTGQNTWSSINDIVRSKDFIQSLINTTLYCTIFGTVITVIMRVINAVIINRTAIKTTS